MNNQTRAFNDWKKEMLKLSEYLPPIWPTEDIMSWGARMEAEKKKYGLTDDEWLELEGVKTDLCLRYGRD